MQITLELNKHDKDMVEMWTADGYLMAVVHSDNFTVKINELPLKGSVVVSLSIDRD